MKHIFLILAFASSLAFGQFEQGTKLMDGTFSYRSIDGGENLDGDKLDNTTSTSLSLTYGQFFMDNLLVSGTFDYKAMNKHGSDGTNSTNILIGADYFFSAWYAGLGMNIPDEGDSELLIGVGMLSPFRESSNVYLHPSLNYWMDSEILELGVGLTLLF